MKHALITLVMALPFTLTAQTTDSTNANQLLLQEGTVVSLSLMQDISSKKNTAGDVIEFETAEPVIIGDRVAIAKGAKVTGKITECEKAKGMGKAGKLNFTIDYLTTPAGKIIKLTTEIKADGKNKTGTAVAEAVLLTPLFLLKKGKNKEFKKGDPFKAFIAQDYTL